MKFINLLLYVAIIIFAIVVTRIDPTDSLVMKSRKYKIDNLDINSKPIKEC